MLGPVASIVGFTGQLTRCRGATSCREAAIASKFKTYIISLSVILTNDYKASLNKFILREFLLFLNANSEILFTLNSFKPQCHSVPASSLEERLAGEIVVPQIVKKFPNGNPKFIAVFTKS